MKKRIIIIVIICITILFLFLCFNKKNMTLECQKKFLIDGDNVVYKYIINGFNNITKEEELDVKLYTSDEYIINDYQNIVSDSMECSGIEFFDDYIGFKCHYNLENSNYYNDITDDNGEVTFASLKKMFEKDEYLCTYK